MLGGGKRGHIHADFKNDFDAGEGWDTQYRRNEIDLRNIFCSNSKCQSLNIQLANHKIFHVRTDNAEV